MSYERIREFQTALELLSARRQYVLEHRRFSENWEKELDALTGAIKSLQQWLSEYNASKTPEFIDEFIYTHQLHLRLENRYSDA